MTILAFFIGADRYDGIWFLFLLKTASDSLSYGTWFKSIGFSRCFFLQSMRQFLTHIFYNKTFIFYVDKPRIEECISWLF